MELEGQEKNLKAWFRRGQCHLGANDPESALADFQKVKINIDLNTKSHEYRTLLWKYIKIYFAQAHEFYPLNKAISNQIVLAKHAMVVQKAKDKELYRSMMKFKKENEAKRVNWF